MHAGVENSCNVKSCPTGSIVRTVSSKQDFFYACPTSQLAQYTNTVIGFVAVQARLSGTLPNISPDTGEPEYEGETKQIIAGLRHLAGVRTFDEAVGQCQMGKNGQRMMVVNDGSKAGGLVMWVASPDGKTSYWMPIGSADLVKKQ